jgi:hypothetical protein
MLCTARIFKPCTLSSTKGKAKRKEVAFFTVFVFEAIHHLESETAHARYRPRQLSLRAEGFPLVLPS